MTLAAARRLVVKVGSSLLMEAGGPNRAWLADLAADVAALRGRGVEVAIVSSGAVALGRARLGLDAAKRLDDKQAAAAAGQAALMHAYEAAFAPFEIRVAQALLTFADTETRRRWLNARATLERLLELGACPIVNENDTVATEELRFGDNDRLAARVAQMLGADGLILLSDVDGLYDRDPAAHPDAAHVPRVDEITPQIVAMAGGPNTRLGVGSGGMASKIAAAQIAADAGAWTAVTLGARPRPLSALDAGERATFIAAATSPAAARKSWIAGALKPAGTLVVDAGAASAIADGKSLLPAGVVEARGAFERGDTVAVLDPAGREIARGLAGYDAGEARAIAGLRSDAIEAALGYKRGAALIHRDHLVSLDRTRTDG